jgi:hypothetical protein
VRRAKTVLIGLLTAWCIGDVAVSLRAEDKQPIWKPLFDGKTLKGWHEFGTKGTWTVKDGVLVGQADKPKLYALLVSDEQYGDFTVRLKFKMFAGNSGFYIRSELRGADEARGLQLEIAPGGGDFTSGIYESYERQWLAKPTAEQAAKLFKKDDWNQFVVMAKGPHVIVHFNGVKTVDFEDPKGRPKGHFVLQQHEGMVNRVMFKDIEILAK